MVASDSGPCGVRAKYKVAVRAGSQTGSQVVKGKAKGLTFTTRALVKGKTYWWQVKACDGAGVHDERVE